MVTAATPRGKFGCGSFYQVYPRERPSQSADALRPRVPAFSLSGGRGSITLNRNPARRISKPKGGPMHRRHFLEAAAGAIAAAEAQPNGPIKPGKPLKITKLETFLVKPRWLFLK